MNAKDFTSEEGDGSAALGDYARPPEPERRTRSWLRWGLAAVALLAATALAWHLWSRPPLKTGGNGKGEDRPVPVAAAVAERADLPIYLRGLGTVTPLATVTVRPRIDGHLMQIAFREGQFVRKGDFLAQIDPRPYQAALAQAEGQLARDQALLRNAETDLLRYRGLVAEDSIARQQLDTQESLVRQYRAAIQVDQGQVDAARLNVGYCRITSPIDGRVGLRQVDEGNYVRTTDTNGIVVITQLQPITVSFTLPQDDLPRVVAGMRKGPLRTDAYDRSGATRLARGELATIDNQIDPTTGTIRMKARFDNADEQLFPNQFVNVRLMVDTVRNATLVPSAAVQYGAQGSYVYVVAPNDTASVRTVDVGPAYSGRTQIVSGLAPGDRVVTDGIDRLREGARVVVQASDAPAAATLPAAGGPPGGGAAVPADPSPSAPGSKRAGAS